MGCSSGRPGSAMHGAEDRHSTGSHENRIYSAFKLLDDNGDCNLSFKELKAASPPDCNLTTSDLDSEFSEYMLQLAYQDLAGFESTMVALENQRADLDREENRLLQEVIEQLDVETNGHLFSADIVALCAKAIGYVAKPGKTVSVARLLNTLAARRAKPFTKDEYASLIRLASFAHGCAPLTQAYDD